jgi:uncharacterized repeat protein (TIGR04052 family)
VKSRTRLTIAALGLTAAAALPAQATAHDETQSVKIRFAAVVGDDAVRCNTPIEGLGTTQRTAQLMDLRFFVANVRMVRRNGSSEPVELRGLPRYQERRGKHGVTLIDLENATGACADGTPGTNGLVRGRVHHGKYVGVRFTLGVPFALNHTDSPSAPAPLNSTAMAWSWQFGRKFTKIEVTDPAAPTGTWSEPAFMVHVGSTDCTGNPATGEAVKCGAPNRASVRLRRFNPKREKVAVDVKALLAGNDITVNRSDAPGCMSGPTDPECEGVFGAIGVDWHVDGSGDGTSAGRKQTLFRPIAR